ncbi:MAG TPA: VOC family protein [Candidatus Udaeobacter sp.]|jgi:predicted enzyme related to lactoylglutathione lyase|nr:VOC family protein [Candidatus Udaeobacter sp.]
MSAASTNLGIKNIGQISIIVHDLERATAFYRDMLGLPLLFTAGNLAFFDCGGVRLMLGPAETPELDHPSSILYFRVPDINTAHQRLVERGVEIEAPPRLIAPMPTYDLWMSGFRDSEGNLLELMSEVPRPA